MYRTLAAALALLAVISVTGSASGRQRGTSPPTTPKTARQKPLTTKPANTPVPPPPAPGTIRLYPTRNYEDAFLTRVPAPAPVNICGMGARFHRRLDGGLKAGSYRVTLAARADRELSNLPPGTIASGKIQVALLVRHVKPRPMTDAYVDRLRAWERANIASDAPPPPDPRDYEKWQQWAVRHSTRYPPSLEDLDQAEEKEVRPSRFVTPLGSTVFDTQSAEQVFTATFPVAAPDVVPGDSLVLDVTSLQATSCLLTGADRFAYIDIPETTLGENRADYQNRIAGQRGVPAAARPEPEPPASGNIRLFLARDEQSVPALTILPAAVPFSHCAGTSRWMRKLEAPLTGSTFRLSLNVSTLGWDDLPGKMRASLVLVRGRTLVPLAATTLPTQSIPDVFTATLTAPGVSAQPGDVLGLFVENMEGIGCVSTEPTSSAFVDIPSAPLAETSADAINRIYSVTGTLVSKTGRPLARKTLILSPAIGVTTYDPSGYMTNPTTETDAKGGFSLRVAAKFFTRTGDVMQAWLQIGEEIPRGFDLVGQPISVRAADYRATQIGLGKVVIVDLAAKHPVPRKKVGA